MRTITATCSDTSDSDKVVSTVLKAGILRVLVLVQLPRHTVKNAETPKYRDSKEVSLSLQAGAGANSYSGGEDRLPASGCERQISRGT